MTQELTVQTPHDLIVQAIDKNLDVHALEKLMELKERHEANEARKLFFQSFNEFQANCPDLRKNKEVNFGQTKFSYAPLSDITRQIGKVLKQAGLSYRWEIQDDNTQIKVTCLISHFAGHTEKTAMSASPDTSGSKNAIQARASAISYMQRYTIIGALGLSTADQDIDGRLPEQDIDKMHKDYMEVYNSVIQIDATLSKYHPDNWRVPPTGKAYVKATGELRKVLFELQNKK